MQFTQASALVALLSASAFGIALPQSQNPNNGNHAGTNNGHNYCGDTSQPQPIIGGTPVDKNACTELRNWFANHPQDFLVTGYGQVLGPSDLGCKFTATVNSGTAIMGSDDTYDLVGTALAAWVDGQSGSSGTYVTGQNAQVPCDNNDGTTQVTVTWQVGQ